MTLTTLYKIFDQMRELYYINDVASFKQKFLEFDENYDIIGFDDVFSFLINVIEMLRDFLLKNS